MKEQSTNITTVPDSKLFEVAKPVTSFDCDFKKQVDLMIKTLRENDGVGLAANQLGFKNRVFVVEFIAKDKKNNIPLQIFVNPQIVKYSKNPIEMNEGCLSVPKIELPILRPEKIKIKAQNINGKRVKISPAGLLARIIQHETDHLHGKIFTEIAKEKLHQENPDLKNLKIVFIGTGSFAEMILRGLILLDLNLKLVVTTSLSPVSQTSKIFKKNLFEVDKIIESKKAIEKSNPDLIILADFGQIIPSEILQIPKIFAVNIHPSLLPKYRGATPIASAILEGAKETGVSIIKMSPKIDQGEIIFQESIEISDDDNAVSLRDLLANLALKMLLNVLPKIQAKKIQPILQDESQATYTHKIKKKDGEINWQDPAEKIDRQIRAYFGWPSAYTFINNKRLIIHQAHLDEDKLVLDLVQPEGKSPMSWPAFLRGFHGQKPEWFKKIKM